MIPRVPPTLRCLLLALVVGAPASVGTVTSAADASIRSCDDVYTDRIDATHVTTKGGLPCGRARRVTRAYFRKVVGTGQVVGGCAQKRLTTGCSVGQFVCRSTGTYTLRGRCSNGTSSVRFRETDRGPG